MDLKVVLETLTLTSNLDSDMISTCDQRAAMSGKYSSHS